MLYSIEDLKNKYSSYSNLNQKISIEVKNRNLYSLKRGLYSSNLNEDYLLIANKIYEPSYISFEYALSFYDLIPEKTINITSASYNKNKNKVYLVNDRQYIHLCIPKKAFSEGYTLIKDEYGNNIKIATKEKAICDRVYLAKSIKSIKQIKELLFMDLRIDIDDFMSLDLNEMKRLSLLYNKVTLNTLAKYLGGIMKHESNY